MLPCSTNSDANARQSQNQLIAVHSTAYQRRYTLIPGIDNIVQDSTTVKFRLSNNKTQTSIKGCGFYSVPTKAEEPLKFQNQQRERQNQRMKSEQTETNKTNIIPITCNHWKEWLRRHQSPSFPAHALVPLPKKCNNRPFLTLFGHASHIYCLQCGREKVRNITPNSSLLYTFKDRGYPSVLKNFFFCSELIAMKLKKKKNIKQQ